MMINLILKFFLTALIAYILSQIMEPHILIRTYDKALWFVLALGVINLFIKPILLILTLPVTILTLGLFLIVLNVLMVMLASKMVDGIYIENFWWGLIFSALLSVFSTSLTKIFAKSG